MLYVYNDCTDLERIVSYEWHRRDPAYYVKGGSWRLVNRFTLDLKSAAHEQQRELIGVMAYEYVPDFSVIQRSSWRILRRQRFQMEWRPWRWSSLVLVRAWQSTRPLIDTARPSGTAV